MNRDWIATARTLSEALPYLQRYTGAIVVIKFGGHAMGDAEQMAGFARDIVLMNQVGVHPVIVHGGGPMINDLLGKLDIQSEFVERQAGDRCEPTMEVVEMVLSGLVNKRIVQAINQPGRPCRRHLGQGCQHDGLRPGGPGARPCRATGGSDTRSDPPDARP